MTHFCCQFMCTSGNFGFLLSSQIYQVFCEHFPFLCLYACFLINSSQVVIECSLVNADFLKTVSETATKSFDYGCNWIFTPSVTVTCSAPDLSFCQHCCFVHSELAWTTPEQCCGMIEKIIGFSLKQFYGDAIELAHSVKVRVILGPVQMRTRQYTVSQMSELISSFYLTGGSVCECVWVKVCLLCQEN